MRAGRRRRFRDLAIGLGGIVLATIAASVLIWVNIGNIEREWRTGGDMREELAWADAAEDALTDQANALDGYISTHDPRYVNSYGIGQRRLDAALAHLYAAASDDRPENRRDVEKMRSLIAAWETEFVKPQLAAAGAGRPPPPVDGDPDRLVNAVGQVLNDLRQDQRDAFAQRDRAVSDALSQTRLALIAASGLAFLFVVAIMARTARQLINERRLAEESARQLREALDHARAAEQAKTRFLANMSHEMRTPLNGVCGLVDALAAGRLDAGQSELVEAIRFSAATLDHLIGDLLSLSRGGGVAGEAHPRSRFDLKDAVRAIGRPFAADAAAKGLALEIEADDALGLVSGDAGGLSQLLSSLLSNAVKFTERGGVKLGVCAAGPGRFAFEVADTGVGFDEARKAELFRPFTQSDDTETRRYGGAGLGLSRAIQLVAELGGELEAQSTPGVGSTFRFEIPLESVAAPPVAPAGAAAAAADEPPLRMLIVDDNPTNRKVLELILDQVGVAWESVENGELAVEAARRQAFAAILMDIQMPVMDGLTATREIRALERAEGRAPAPVIVVSANCQPEHVEAGRAAGAQRHLGKPVSAQVLIETLNDVLCELPEAA